MKKMIFVWLIAASLASGMLNAAEPLRVFIRGGKKSHGPGAHEHEQFLNDWTKLLTGRGMKVSGGMNFPTTAELAGTDVLLMYAQDGGTVPPERRADLAKFLKGGGGLVVIHTASVSADTAHWKSIIGGAWVNGGTKWLEGPMALYYSDAEHPITKGASNFDLDDEIYYDMDLSPDIHVLAAAYTPKSNNANSKNLPATTSAERRASVYDIQPQMWTYERTLEGGKPYRAFVSIPGHLYTNFARPNYRAVLLRGIAWTAKRSNVDEFCTSEELASLRYPEGGPTAPEKASVKLEVHPDFNISLVAAEPLIAKPININWDAKGRLWVAETPEYPNGRKQPNVEVWKDSGSLVRQGAINDRPARDRISILIDTDGDGRADKKEIFYEGLELVTSFVFHKDGVIASAAPDIWLIRDTDGNGKADTVTRLYTGLGTNDTHAVINNLRWGFDGWIYATHGYSASEHVRSGDGRTDYGRIGSGVVRFKPDGSAFEQYCSKGGNTWGLDIAWDNEVLFTQPTSGDLLNHVVLSESVLSRGQVPGARSYNPLIVRRKSYPLMTYEKQAYVQIDLVGSFTASAGCAIYDGGTWPPEWSYSYFTTEPTINLIHHEVVKPDGVSFVANKVREPEFIAARDMWFRPIETRIGPDGALYICDFYNQAVVHNDTRGPRHGPANAAVRPDRDHYFGRIWRVDHKQARKIDLPDLSVAKPAALVKALDHPNLHVRMTAQRLITEQGAGLAAPQFLKSFSPLAAGVDPSSVRANIHWQWILSALNIQPDPETPAPLRDNPEFRKNSLRVLTAAAVTPSSSARRSEQTSSSSSAAALLPFVTSPNARVSLDAIVALAPFTADDRVSAALVAIYPVLKDPWRESAVIGVATQAPDQFIAAALASDSPGQFKAFVSTLSGQVAAKGNAAQLASIVQALAGAPATADSLKQLALETIARSLNAASVPNWTLELKSSFQKLLSSASPAISAATLPFIARWDTERTLVGDIKNLITTLTSRLQDASVSDSERAQAVSSLLPVRQMNGDILPAVGKLLGPPASAELQRRVIDALGATGDSAVGSALAAAYGRLDSEVRNAALGQLLKRRDWSLAFLDALDSGAAAVGELGPADFHRLRTHPDIKVSARANQLWEKARGGAGLEKDALIAKFTPIVTQPGDVKKGKDLFTQNCATCHKLDDLGNEIGPVLTGMGAHGPAELLVHILDPNREVEPSYVAYNFETKDGETYDGIIARENRTTVAIRNAAGEKEILLSQIQSRKSSGRSLMPEGFEALGGENLRDLLAFVCAGENRFRFIDLNSAYTADSRRGIYVSQEGPNDTLKFKRFGVAMVAGVPFNIVDPAKNMAGRNLLVLKGGSSGAYSKTFPQRVEAKVGFALGKLHFLGGVAGWGYPFGGDDTPVMKLTVHYADGQKEEMVMKNGHEFADYIRVVDVPGSTLAEGVVTANQVRTFSKPVSRQAVVEKLVLESFDNGVAPTTVAITAELPGAPGAPAPQKNPASVDASRPVAPFDWDEGTRVLLVGGGSSHNFDRFFNIADSATLKDPGHVAVHYTEDPAVTARELPRVDVAVLSVNKEGFPTEALRQALLGFVEGGKGLVLLHPGVWYNWREWPEYNRDLAGGGSRGHDAVNEFEVKVTGAAHPLTKDLPATFKITDELYWFQPDAKGTPIQILASTHSPSKKSEFPMIWVVKHPKARIAGIALGHDARAHDLPEYKQLLKNAVTWAARQDK